MNRFELLAALNEAVYQAQRNVSEAKLALFTILDSGVELWANEGRAGVHQDS